MRTAYCISAYKDAPLLDRLIGALEGDDTCFIVHVDKRIGDIEPFRRAVAKHKDARMTTRRYLVQWGSWAQVRYQQLFLEEALAAGADRIFIISGQDYPLWSNDRLHSYCTDNADRAFVIGLDLTALPPPMPPMRRYLELWHPCRDLPIKSRCLYRAITAGLRTLLRVLPFRRKPYLTVDGCTWHVWQASAYLSVNHRQAQYIVDRLRDRRITDYFRHCFVPEELTIPTIIFNSPFRDKAQVYGRRAYDGIASLSATHYFYYSGSVRVLTMADLPTLLASGRMFCRKVAGGISDGLMDEIDRRRQQATMDSLQMTVADKEHSG